MNLLKKIFRKIKKEVPSIKHGIDGINEVGHRKYVGGMWEEIGKLQYNFLIENGLKPEHVFLDIACGSLRAGVHLIPYLDKGNYMGIEKEKELVDLGIQHEINESLLEGKKPEFLISNDFEFDKLSKTANFALAQSLFTHLPPNLIDSCFQNLSKHFDKDGVFFATYFIAKQKSKNSKTPHDHAAFKYTIEEVKNFGEKNGWNSEYIGDWNHPRNQKMVKYTLK